MAAKKPEPIPDIVYSGHRPISPGPPKRKPAYDTISDQLLAAHVYAMQSRIDRAIKVIDSVGQFGGSVRIEELNTIRSILEGET